MNIQLHHSGRESFKAARSDDNAAEPDNRRCRHQREDRILHPVTHQSQRLSAARS